MKKLYIVDASGYLYRSYFAIRNMTNAKGESTNALYGFIRSLFKLIKDFQPEYLVSVFDGPHSIKSREAIYEQYKAHRTAMPSDLLAQITRARHFCELMGIPMLSIPEVEADDTMGTIALWCGRQHGMTSYLCTSDKDLCQFVNDHTFILNTHKDNLILDAAGVKESFGVNPDQIVDFLSITGDSSDNIPGLPGFGPKTAAELLQKFGSLDYLLAHPEEVPGKKKQEILVQEAEKALISRRLVQINTAVDIPKDVAFYKIQPLNIPALREFYQQMNFNSLLKELEQLAGNVPDEKIQYRLVDDEPAFNNLLEQLRRCKEICFDTETTSLDPMQAELVGIGFGTVPEIAYYVPANGALGLKRVLEGLKPLFENPNIGFYGHNVKYDYQVLKGHQIEVANIAFDSLLASYILNAHSRQHSLDQLSLENFGKVKTPISELIGKGKNTISMRDVPIEKVCAYCCEDVDYTCRLKIQLEKQLKERNLEGVYHTVELPLVKVLAHMERRGIFLETSRLKELSHEVMTEISRLSKEIYALAGEEFNLNSPKQLGAILFEKLKIPATKKIATGYTTSADALESLKWSYPIVGKIIDYRILEKLRSTYIETLPLQVNPKTGRIHCNFNQTVAATGRLSSQDPNLQNIPVRTELGRKIREAFRPGKEDWSYLSADYSQIELRLLAHLSEDPPLVSAFLNKEDIHAYTASCIFGVSLETVTKNKGMRLKR